MTDSAERGMSEQEAMYEIGSAIARLPPGWKQRRLWEWCQAELDARAAALAEVTRERDEAVRRTRQIEWDDGTPQGIRKVAELYDQAQALAIGLREAEARASAAEQSAARLRALLRELEWSHSDDVSDRHCPSCAGQHPDEWDERDALLRDIRSGPPYNEFAKGHKPGCALLAALSAPAQKEPTE